MLLKNCSKCSQVIHLRSSCFPITVHPGGILDNAIGLQGYDEEAFKEFTLDQFHNLDYVGLHRTYAMGDLIQLIPVAREFKRHFNVKKVSILTSPYIVNELKFLFKDIDWTVQMNNSINGKWPLVYSLDGCLECDHSMTNHERNIHRVFIYSDRLGLPRFIPNWNPSGIPKNEVQLNTKIPKIGIQIRGSGAMKTLPKDYIRNLVADLSKKYEVVLLDYSKDEGFEGKNILNTCGKLKVYQCIALLAQLDACITMDSGMLWFAHVARCPVVTLLGPTREAERVSLHPLYPKKAKSISISEMNGCNACFETMCHCNKAINCMKKFDREKLTKNIFEQIQSILETK